MLADAIARVAPDRFSAYLLSVGEPDSADWVRVADLHGALGDALARVREDTGVARDDVLAQWMAEWLGWVLAHPLVALLAAEGVVPVVDRSSSVLFGPNGRPMGLRVSGALGGELVGQTADVLATSMAWLAAFGRRAESALWRGASDRIARAFFAEARGDEALLQLGRDMLSAPGPLCAPPRFGPDAFVRAGCCLVHATGGALCADCPLTTGSGLKTHN